jgi:hypothetical protein
MRPFEGYWPRSLHRKIKRRRARFNGFLKDAPVTSRSISGSTERLISAAPACMTRI